LRRIAANARKLERLLGDLLDLDRLQRGIVAPQRRPTDVSALVAQTIRESDLLLDRKVELDAEPVVADVDAAKVERIVENLVSNAARHTPGDSPVIVRVARQDDGVLIVVEDEGPGVPDDLKRAIFEPFRQGDGVPNPSPGVGVGLSLVARFAELHGGRAWVEDRPQGGASFRVFLPGSA
jgi:signal transduction histidine kinase